MINTYCLINGVLLPTLLLLNRLKELMLLEEFMNCVPEKIVVHLNEQNVSSLSEAAVMADEFVLTHKGVFFAAGW